MSDPRHWTPDQDATLASMKAAGKSYREIGLAVGRSLQAVKQRAEIIGAKTGDAETAHNVRLCSLRFAHDGFRVLGARL